MKRFAIAVFLALGFLGLSAKPAAAYEAHVIGVTARIQLSDVLLNEIYANTNDGEDEWVELYNRGGGAVDISGWVIKDPGDQASHKIVIPDGTILNAGAKYRGYFTTNVLNNNGDTVYLFDADGRMRDKFVYSDTIKGKSWKRNPDGSGNWVDPEPSFVEETGTEPEPDLDPPAEPAPEPTPTPEPEPEITAPPEASVSAKPVPPIPESSESAQPKEEDPVDGT
jgi:hypothetical protein